MSLVQATLQNTGGIDWAVAIIAAIIGACLTIGLKELVDWLLRPRLVVGFEEGPLGSETYIHNLRIKNFIYSMGLFRRLVVKNLGRKPAMNCEAKLTIFKGNLRESDTPILHWARKDPEIYLTPEQVFSPVHINSRDEEVLDFVELDYNPEERVIPPGACIETVSANPYRFQRNTFYKLLITVFANNAVSNQ